MGTDNKTIVFEPFKWDSVTKRRSGHFLFENSNGILVFFPFDSFYHDIEGQGRRKGDICFTPLSHIWSRTFRDELHGEWHTKEHLRDLIYKELKRKPIAPYQRAACVLSDKEMQPMGDYSWIMGNEGPGGKFPFDWTAFGEGSVEAIYPEARSYSLRPVCLEIIREKLYPDWRDETRADNLVRDIMKNYYKENPELVQPERLAQRNMTRGD